MKRPRLGNILLESGIIDELQLQAALAYQRQWGMPLGRALVEKRLCTAEQVLRALAKQSGLPAIDLDKESLGAQQCGLLTLKVAEQYVAAFANLAKTGNTLIVPSNLADLATLVTSVTTMFKAQER